MSLIAVRYGERETLEDFTQGLLDAQQETWDAAWILRDMCLQAVEHAPGYALPGWLQALQETTGISHRKIQRWAEEAELVPPDARAADRAPGPQITEARRRRDT